MTSGMDTPFDKMKEACGVFAIFDHADAARMAYLGLHQLQHRGQESAGIVVSDREKFRTRVGMGLVSEVFDTAAIDHLTGSLAVAHCRYGTAGDSSVINAQPLVVRTSRGPLALAHNGNLTNAFLLREQLEEKGAIFQTSSDSEVALHLIAHSKAPDLEGAIKDAFSQVLGAYSIALMSLDTIYAVRDPWGVRPLHIGRLDGSTVIASETCAFGIIGASLVREVEPGEIVAIDRNGIRTVGRLPSTNRHHCVFEFVYFSRPDSSVFGRSVYEVRTEMGRQLAREAPADADVVMPVPDSSVCASLGYAEQSKIPSAIGMIRSHYVGRTFIEPRQSIRDFGARMKYSPVPEALAGKRVVLIDDSIVRGTTSRKIIRMIREAGAKEIHMRISSPPVVAPCFYGIDTPTKEELVGSHMSVEQIRQFLECDSLQYLSLDGMLRSTGKTPNDFCTACFTDRYPIEIRFDGRTGPRCGAGMKLQR